jgi:hypothetical protein
MSSEDETLPENKTFEEIMHRSFVSAGASNKRWNLQGLRNL